MKVNFPVNQINLNNKNNVLEKDNNNAVSFSDFLNSAIKQVNNLQIESEKLNEAFALGKTDNIHQVMIAAEKADLALQFTMQIRNKLLDAYQEIMRMPV
ncbi:MAG: flagellar hook-basal body complex protein FliE [Bacillota bacterium]